MLIICFAVIVVMNLMREEEKDRRHQQSIPPPQPRCTAFGVEVLIESSVAASGTAAPAVQESPQKNVSRMKRGRCD